MPGIGDVALVRPAADSGPIDIDQKRMRSRARRRTPPPA
jgi:hypothetical protein